jgi:hypothetical protein
MLKVKRNWGGPISKRQDDQGRYRCSACKEWKNPESFNKNKQQSSGLNYSCKQCSKAEARKYNLPAKYGITTARFAEMLLAQGGKCACCEKQFNMEGKSSDRPCVDHNHLSGEIRELLCGRCNLAAGNVMDSSSMAEKLASYLKKWKC